MKQKVFLVQDQCGAKYVYDVGTNGSGNVEAGGQPESATAEDNSYFLRRTTA